MPPELPELALLGTPEMREHHFGCVSRLFPTQRPPLETAPSSVSHLGATGRSPVVVDAITGGQSCTGYRQPCSDSRAEELFSGQPEGALVPEVLLRDFPRCSGVKATFLAACLAPTTSRPLLNTEG